MKDSIPYSQTLRIKRICFKISEEVRQLKDLKDAYIKRSYQSKILNHHSETPLDRKILLKIRITRH